MAKEIIWSPRADKNFDRIIEYLKKDWTEKEVIKFVQKTYQILEKLKKGNITYRSSKKKNIYQVLITKHNLLIYSTNRNSIELLAFYDTRQHPNKKKF